MTTRTGPTGRRFGRRLAAVACVAAIGIGGLTVANAATLTVSGGGVSTVEVGPCTTGEIDVSRVGFILYYGVQLTGIPAECQNKPVVVSASNNSITGTSTGATTSSLQVGTGIYFGNPTFTVVIDGWIVSTD